MVSQLASAVRRKDTKRVPTWFDSPCKHIGAFMMKPALICSKSTHSPHRRSFRALPALGVLALLTLGMADHSTPALGQTAQSVIVVPNTLATLAGDMGTLEPLGKPLGQTSRYQQVYAKSQFGAVSG